VIGAVDENTKLIKWTKDRVIERVNFNAVMSEVGETLFISSYGRNSCDISILQFWGGYGSGLGFCECKAFVQTVLKKDQKRSVN